MKYPQRMNGYSDTRTYFHIDALHAWKAGKNFPPVIVEIDPTNRCIQKCRYCYNNSRVGKGELDGELLVGLPKQLADAGVKSILFQGSGEPLMHKALPKTIINGAQHGLNMTLTTSGVLLTPELQHHILPNIFYLRLSVLESDPKRYGFLHGVVDEQWHKLIGNIEYAADYRKKHNLPITLLASVYLEEINFDYAYSIVKFYKEMGLDYIIVQEAVYGDYSPSGDRAYPSDSFSPERIAEMGDLVLSLNDDDFAVKWNFPVNLDYLQSGMYKNTFARNFCQGIKFSTVIEADGNVIPCWRAWGKPELSYGNLYEQSFSEIWNGQQRQDIIEFIMTTPPKGYECDVCNNRKNNVLLDKLNNPTKWKDFLI